MATYGNGHSNGYSLGRFMDADRALHARVTALVPSLREKAREEVKARKAANREEWLHFGYRFNDNDAVAVRVVSAFDGIEEHLNDFIIAALLDCAFADYWYTFEKDYG